MRKLLYVMAKWSWEEGDAPGVPLSPSVTQDLPRDIPYQGSTTNGVGGGSLSTRTGLLEVSHDLDYLSVYEAIGISQKMCVSVILCAWERTLLEDRVWAVSWFKMDL